MSASPAPPKQQQKTRSEVGAGENQVRIAQNVQ